MKIGMIVYSKTGHTLSVAKKLREKLAAAGHTVTLEQVETAGVVNPNDTHVMYRRKPKVDGYDALIFGAPVQGGTPALPMRIYMEQLPSLAGVPVACLVTGFFPAEWGRKQTLAQMKDLLEAKGARVCGEGSVGWFSLTRGKQIKETVEGLSRAFS
jgi:flavodoxin